MTSYLSVNQVAERLGVSRWVVRGWISNGELRAIDMSVNRPSKRPRLMVAQADLDAFLERRATSPPMRVRQRPHSNGIPNYIS